MSIRFKKNARVNRILKDINKLLEAKPVPEVHLQSADFNLLKAALIIPMMEVRANVNSLIKYQDAIPYKDTIIRRISSKNV